MTARVQALCLTAFTFLALTCAALVHSSPAAALPQSQYGYFSQNVHSSGVVSSTLPAAGGTITSHSCSAITLTTPGAAPGDAVAYAVPNTASLLTLNVVPFVSAYNTVTLEFCNQTGSTYNGSSVLSGYTATTFHLPVAQ